jgi:hypothetical protein
VELESFSVWKSVSDLRRGHDPERHLEIRPKLGPTETVSLTLPWPGQRPAFSLFSRTGVRGRASRSCEMYAAGWTTAAGTIQEEQLAVSASATTTTQATPTSAEAPQESRSTWRQLGLVDFAEAWSGSHQHYQLCNFIALRMSGLSPKMNLLTKNIVEILGPL